MKALGSIWEISDNTFLGSVETLSDADLGVPRKTNWGELAETRWIVSVLIEHDLYHSGEINHIRALRQGNDRWAHELDSHSA